MSVSVSGGTTGWSSSAYRLIRGTARTERCARGVVGGGRGGQRKRILRLRENTIP
jgi:hypothetical protein